MDNHHQESVNTPLIVDENNLDESRKSLIFLEEAKKQIWLAGPLLIVNLFTMCIQTISIMFVGHVGNELALSGASLATSFATVTGFSFLIGGGNALDTFCGQSYGAKQYSMLGIHMQRAMFVLILICIPIACLWANTGQILQLLGQDPRISTEAGIYARFLIPGIFAYALLQCQIKFLGCQNNVVPMMITTGFTTALHILLCYVLVFKSKLGSNGAALAQGLSYWSNVVLLAIYIRFSPSCNTVTWTGFSKKALHDIPLFIRLAIPSALMMCLEIWSAEAIVLLSGFLPDPTLETSVLSISLNTLILISAMPIGLGAAVSVRVSNELGAGHPQKARLAAWVGMGMVYLESISVSTMMILGRKFLGYCFSNETRVVNYVGEMMVLVAIFHLFDCLQVIISGVARGCGWQKICVYVNLGAYFVIGIPLGMVLAFVFHLGGKGLWCGILVAVFVQALVFLVITFYTNWEKQILCGMFPNSDILPITGHLVAPVVYVRASADNLSLTPNNKISFIRIRLRWVWLITVDELFLKEANQQISAEFRKRYRAVDLALRFLYSVRVFPVTRIKPKSMDIHEEREGNKCLETPLIIQEKLIESRKGLIFGLNKDEFLAEAKKQIFLAGPLLIVNIFTACIQTISVMFVGHVGSELALSGASMASSFAIVTGFSLLLGGANALDTFCGQSYGAKQYHMLGIHMQKAMSVLLLISIPLAFIWGNAGHILLSLGQDPDISAEAGVYARFMIPSIFAYALLQCQMRFLGSQNNVVPMMITTGVTTLLHTLLCWVLVFQSGLGSKGAALATGVTYWINVILLALYIRYSPSCNTKTWNGFSTKAFHDVPMFIRLAVPSAFMVCLEIWSCEVVVLLAGLLPDPTLETSVMSISMNTLVMFSTIPLGLGAAVSVRVSNELGAGRSKEARMAVRVGMCMVVIESISVATLIVLGHKIIGYSYTGEERVVNYVGKMMLLVAATHLFDGIQCVGTGVARGCGWQEIGAYVNLGAYFLIGIPVGLLLAFVFHLGGKGLWSGIIVAVFVQALILFAITVRTKWEKQAEKASTRIMIQFDEV